MPSANWTRSAIAVFSVLLLLAAWLTGGSLDDNFLRWASGAASVVVLLFLVYDKWAWRWPGIRKAAEWAGKPVIYGTWKGDLHFQRDQQGQPGTIRYYLAVDQTFSRVQLRAFVDSSETNSITATIARPMPTRRQLVFVYHSAAPLDARDDNRPHDGTAVLSIVGIPVEELTGSYYNERPGRGSIELTEHTKKITESFSDAERQTYKPTVKQS
jgi:hypothetical protein